MDHRRDAVAVLERGCQRAAQPGLVLRRDDEVRHRQLDRVFLEALDARELRGRQEHAVDPQVRVAACRGPLGKVGVDALAIDDQRRQHADVFALRLAHHLRDDRVERLRRHWNMAVGAVLHAELHVDEPQEVIELGQRGHGRLASAARGALLDRDRRRDAVDRVDVGPAGRLHDRARVGVQRLEVAALSFVEQDVERQCRLARAGDAGDHGERVTRNVDIDRLQVVLARIAYFDDITRCAPALAHQRLQRAAGVVRGPRLVDPRRMIRERGPVRGQLAPGVRACDRDDVVRRPDGDDFSTCIAALGPEVDQPVGRRDDVEVVLDDDQRVARRQQLAERAHQLGDVVEVQAGGRLVEQEQRPARRRLAAGGLGEEARELQPLRFAAGQRGHRLAELHVLEPDVDQRRQHARDFGVVAEEGQRLADRHVEHVGDAGRPSTTVDGDLQRFGSEALAVAVGAAQVDVRQELHLDVFEAVAAAGRAAPVAGIEREGAGGVVALLRHARLREDRADRVERADVARRVGARRLADLRLVDERDVVEPVIAEQAVEGARGFGALSLRLRECRVQHVLDQRRLAAARHAGDADEPLQRNLEIDRLQVVLARALQHDLRRIRRHRQRARGVDRLPSAEVAARQRLGPTQLVGRAVEDDASAALARAWPHVEHAVGRQHHLRVVLDDDQRIAGIAQPVHHLDRRDACRADAGRSTARRARTAC